MQLPVLDDVESIRAFEFGLLMACPINGDPNPQTCPLHEVRLRPVAERFQYVESLSDEESIKIYHQHRKCYAERTGQVDTGTTKLS